MSSKNDHEQRTPYVQRKPQKLCLDCKEKNDCSKIEEVIDNFHENHIKPNKISLNSVHCELEYDLSCFTLENLLILQLKIATQQ
ncbi:hypothetical protein RhiirA5_423010 [Rhizophagus irregularis]|uniref:Uncharacterized protein n=1 Tax=Rhizophagus irregularis TaxID=588596 RepID=A0A2N0PAT0_9GLOM|nr:hypothetical protein RhiirA5_423010 [Rhizophagus irregularis]